MVNIPKIQKALYMYPHIPKIDPSIPYPFKYLQKYPVSLIFVANIPVALKPRASTIPSKIEFTLENMLPN